LRPAGPDPGPAQPGDDGRDAAVVLAVAHPGVLAGLGRAGRRDPAGAGAVARDGTAGHPPEVPLQLQAPGRETGLQPDAADDLFVLGGPGERTGRHRGRLRAGPGRAGLAVLLGPADRTAAGPVRRGHRDRDPAPAVPPPRGRGRGVLLAVAGLGPAHRDA